jgi:hypothetical protein
MSVTIAMTTTKDEIPRAMKYSKRTQSNPISKATGLNEALGQVLTGGIQFNILSGFIFPAF